MRAGYDPRLVALLWMPEIEVQPAQGSKTFYGKARIYVPPIAATPWTPGPERSFFEAPAILACRRCGSERADPGSAPAGHPPQPARPAAISAEKHHPVDPAQHPNPVLSPRRPLRAKGGAWLVDQVVPENERLAIERHLREFDRPGEDLKLM